MSIDSSSFTSNAQLSQLSNVSSRQLPDGANSTQSSAPVRTLNTSTASVQQNEAAAGAQSSIEDLQAAVEKMNELMQNSQRSLHFSVDDSTEEVVIKVVDQETDEVVRQIPSEEQLKFSEFLEGMVGLVFDEEA